MCDLSIVIVSFNAREALRDCLRSLRRDRGDIDCEVVVLDNASHDGSAEMVEGEFPEVRLLRSEVNLGFAAANNRLFACTAGRYVVLLNPDAVLEPGALARSLERMDSDPTVGLGGGRLIGADHSWQPSARAFPSALNDFLSLSGLADRYPSSRFFGRADRTWANAGEVADVDWVPGAYALVRRSVLEEVGTFDERFFLYYEEVDLCRRIKAAGYTVQYWPDVVIVHRGGESAKSHEHLDFSASGSQLTAWRMRSGLLYHRKHGGTVGAWLTLLVEAGWYALRAGRNALSRDPVRRAKQSESLGRVSLMLRAWRDTAGGRLSPARPW